MGTGTSTPLSRVEVQQQADAWTQADYERSTAAATLGYTFTEAFPALVSEADVMTVTYYSTYDFPKSATADFVAETGMGPTTYSKTEVV